MTISTKQISTIEASDLFDRDWYRARYKDVDILGIRPAEHYLRIGARLLRDPGPDFSAAYYLATYPDVAKDGMPPLLHFIAHGREEGRRCLPPPPAPAELQQPRLATGDDADLRPGGDHRVHPGRKGQMPQARTILVCAHVSGKHLFGGERSLLDILDGLSDAGYNAVVVTPGIRNGDYLDELRDRSLAVVSCRYGWWRKGVPIDESVVATFARIIAEHGIDAVHVNTIMLREPLLAAQRIGIPAVAHVRELVTHDVALCDLIGESPQQIVAHVLENTDWIIANSETTARAFAKTGATSVLPNTVDTDVFDIGAPGNAGTINIALISSNLPKKGIHDFVAVADLLREEVPNARFLLIGPKNDHMQELQRQQAVGKTSANIVVSGYRDDPVKAIAETDILLNLSHFQESFGRTVLEAMAARRPVIVYDWGALPELVVDGHTGYIVPFKDVRAVAEKVRALCEDRNKLKAMGEAARQRAVAQYGKSHYGARLKDAYASLFLETAKRPPRLTLRARSPHVNNDAPTPPRIAYFLWHFPVPSETFVLNELRVLVAQGHDVQVFCRQSPYPDFKPDFPVQWTQVTDADDLAHKLLGTGRNLVHSHFTYPTVTEMVWPACEAAEVPFTFIAHAQDIFRHANDERNRIGEIGRSPWCVKVLVPSRFHRKYVEERGVPSHKLMVNPNGIDPALYEPDDESQPGTRSRRSVCAVHRFTEKKGLEHLIRAGHYLAEDGVQIHLYGYGHLEEAYREIIANEGLTNVFIHGPVTSRADLIDVFRQHDLFACPSVRAADGDMDGIPTVLMEAMSTGIPVLATNLSGIPDLVKDGVTGLLCEPDPVDIAETVRRFYELPDAEVSAIIEDARTLIRRDFDASRLVSNLQRVWEGRLIDLIIVSWNNPVQLREVVGRLQKFTSLPFHLIICDNGSGPETIAHLCEVYAAYDNTTIVFNRDNAYVGPGTNICLQIGTSDYAIYVCGKEGFVLDYGWERRFVDHMDANPGHGLAGTKCYSPSYLTGAGYPDAIPQFAKFRNKDFAYENPDRRFCHVQGGLFVIRRKMFEEIGGFSDAVPHSYTDVEYCFYAESQGWELGSVTGVLALFNKTRPGLFSRVDESVSAVHPPTLEDLPLLDRISSGSIAHCNLCHWSGDAFHASSRVDTCPQCASRPEDRTLYRYLAESMLTYRRLPALGVEVGAALAEFWKNQFQGQIVSRDELGASLESGQQLSFRDGSLKLVYLGYELSATRDHLLLTEVDRVLSPDGVMIFRGSGPSVLDAIVRTCGLREIRTVRFSSRVVRYDTGRIYVGRRAEVDRCVS